MKPTFKGIPKNTPEQREFLAPHGIGYLTELKPIFLHGLWNTTLQGPYLCRDGLLSLVNFFYRNPEPRPGTPALLVNEKFSAFVPSAWEALVSYYAMGSKLSWATETALNEVRDVYLILTVIDARQSTPEFIGRQVDSLRARLGARFFTVNLHVLTLWGGGSHYLSKGARAEAPSEYYFTALQVIFERAAGTQVRHATWEQVERSELRHSAFVDLNEYDFYYSDSYVAYRFLSQGSLPLGRETLREDSLRSVDFSFYHFAREYATGRGASEPSRKLIQDSLRSFLATSIFQDEYSFFHRKKRYFLDGEKFCPRSLEHLVYSWVVRLNSSTARLHST